MTQCGRIVAETARLILRTEQAGDFATWLEHMNRPEVMAFLGGPQSEDAIMENFARMRQAQDLPFLFVALRETGTLIGKCGLSVIETPEATGTLRGKPQIGWTLRADQWGKGYAREAAEAMFAIGFGDHGLEAIYGQTSESNAASWRLMEKLGMARCATLDYVDPAYPQADNPTIVYEIGRREWAARKEAAA